ncbi:MAG TPA: primosomal protein DnaI [Candidatus Coprovivens excrementavium]|nr:primosomal protein DnaI [Candidatus Coprovivens excrementavium]
MEIRNNVNERALKSSYAEAYKDQDFRRLVKTIKADDKTAMKYTSSLQETTKELNHCRNCPGLIYCQNRLEGHIMYPRCNDNQIIFSYMPCKYEKERREKEKNRMTRDKELSLASMAQIDGTDKKRVPVIKWLINFCDQYDPNKNNKGLYLHGTFGCGKTYLISAAFNELSKKRISTEIVYYPELLRDLKSDFDTFADRIDYLENVDLLLIDDIGAEKVTEWSRDEILGTILQHRMNNYKATFFTSNLNIEQLEEHLIINSNIDEIVKAKRIIERIKQLSEDMELIGENKRK